MPSSFCLNPLPVVYLMESEHNTKNRSVSMKYSSFGKDPPYTCIFDYKRLPIQNESISKKAIYIIDMLELSVMRSIITC